jgi:hypothetical protein
MTPAGIIRAGGQSGCSLVRALWPSAASARILSQTTFPRRRVRSSRISSARVPNLTCGQKISSASTSLASSKRYFCASISIGPSLTLTAIARYRSKGSLETLHDFLPARCNFGRRNTRCRQKRRSRALGRPIDGLPGSRKQPILRHERAPSSIPVRDRAAATSAAILVDERESLSARNFLSRR